MTKINKVLPLLLLMAAVWISPLTAQTPDCSFTFTATGNATQTGQGNLSGGTPCANWRITFSVTGTLATTVTFQTSPDNSTFTSVPNTICSSSVQPPCIFQGTNPLTGTTQGMSLFASYGSYVRVTTSSSSGTGTVTIRGYGAKGTSASAAQSPGSSSGGGGSVGAAGAVQSSDGSGNFADSGCTATSGLEKCTSFASTGTGAGSYATLVPNDGSTGTTAKLLSKINSSGNAVIATTSDTAIPVFITLATSAPLGCTAGTTGNACLVSAGQGTCTADASGITAGHFVIASTATNGRCEDGGSTTPTSYALGIAATTCAANADCTVQVVSAAGASSAAAGSTLFSTTTSTTVTAASATTLIGTVTGSTTIPANTFAAGTLMEVLAEGFYSTPAAARTLTINLLIGGSTRITTGAITVLPSITNGVWRLHCGVTTRTASATGTQIANCIFEQAPSSTSVLTPANASMQTSSTWTVDTTGTLVFGLQAAWDATTGSPTITATNIAAWIPGAGSGGTVTVTPPYLTTGGTSYGQNWVLKAPPTAGWTADNCGSCTFDTTNGYPYLHTAGGGTTDSFQGEYRTGPSAPYGLVTLMTHDLSGQGAIGNEMTWSIGWRNTDGKILSFIAGTTDASPTLGVCSFSASTAGCSASLLIRGGGVGQWANTGDLASQQGVYIKLADDNTNLTISYSIDGGNHFIQFYQQGRTAAPFNTGVGAPTQIIFGTVGQSRPADVALISYQ